MNELRTEHHNIFAALTKLQLSTNKSDDDFIWIELDEELNCTHVDFILAVDDERRYEMTWMLARNECGTGWYQKLIEAETGATIWDAPFKPGQEDAWYIAQFTGMKIDLKHWMLNAPLVAQVWDAPQEVIHAIPCR